MTQAAFERTKYNNEIVIKTHLQGKSLLNNTKLNKGTAFTKEERDTFKISGMLPEIVQTIEEQMSFVYYQFKEKKTNLQKNIFLNGLHDNNETLFYALVLNNLEEMLPIIYTPTVGEAVEKFSLELRRYRGLYISYQNIDQIDEIIQHRSNPTVKLIVVTDGEGVLGIGDQGIGSMKISIAKLMVYTLCAGIDPNVVLPIQLDVGTNNETLLNDHKYLGWRHKRITGEQYDIFIDKFVTGVTKEFPNVYLHWEDFGRENARKNLNRYKNSMCTFNDDMQGTGLVALACILAGLKATKRALKDQVVVIYGAGTAGVGVADQIRDAMIAEGLTPEEANARFWLVDRHGLLTEVQEDIIFFQKPYLKTKKQIKSWTYQDSTHITLQEVVKQSKATILIGCSTDHGAFNESIVTQMSHNTSHPFIFPLSNPTSHSEAHPQDILNWTHGNAFIATGSPFPKCQFNGKDRPISQSNNAYVFPGLGLGIIISNATRLTPSMLIAACNALSDEAPINTNPKAPLLPKYKDTTTVSKKIAKAVALQAIKDNVSPLDPQTDIDHLINQHVWAPRYVPYIKKN